MQGGRVRVCWCLLLKWVLATWFGSAWKGAGVFWKAGVAGWVRGAWVRGKGILVLLLLELLMVGAQRVGWLARAGVHTWGGGRKNK